MHDETVSDLSRALNEWFTAHARPLPWREPTATPWHILVSEFMLQQTQVDRVLPRYLEWVRRWPTPADLAVAPASDALRAWERLGYPRRALWLHAAATQIAADHHNTVPRSVDVLLSLTGIGPYTARAVAAFAYGDRHPVVDTNTRRVLARLRHGLAAAAAPAPRDLTDMSALLPEPADAARTFNAAAMELGAVVCTARAPRCGECPIAQWCEWRGAGFPDNAPEKRSTQARFDGSDRQVRGRIMAALRGTSTALQRDDLLQTVTEARSVSRKAAATVPTSAEQAERCLVSLLSDGLAVETPTGIQLPD